MLRSCYDASRHSDVRISFLALYVPIFLIDPSAIRLYRSRVSALSRDYVLRDGLDKLIAASRGIQSKLTQLAYQSGVDAMCWRHSRLYTPVDLFQAMALVLMGDFMWIVMWIVM